MGVVSPERQRPAPPGAPAPPPEPPRRFPSGLVTLGVVVLSFVLLAGWARDLLPDLGNPFREETVVRSGPALLKSIQDIRQYRAATGHFEVIVDVERDTRFVPALIKGERVLFVAVGTVDAGVDFSGLGGEAVDVSDDRLAVTVTLPPARFFGAVVDPARSYVYDRDRGVIDRVASVFEDSPTGERELYRLAEEKLASAARENSGLLRRAERNTRVLLEGMLGALGFETVAVRFEEG
ncbi:MAG: DUF4230 domain-containing protein [Gaiellaceae bacterium]